MTFFVSDSLKGRVTEEELAKDSKIEYIDENLADANLSVHIQSEDGSEHIFEFRQLIRSTGYIQLSFEIPQTYRFISKLFEDEIQVNLKNDFGTILSKKTKIDIFDLTKQNERNCYLLKIFIEDSY